MRRTTCTLRILTLGLALAATACRSTPAHADGLDAPKDAPKDASPKGERASGGGGFGGSGDRVEFGRTAIAPAEQGATPAAADPLASPLEVKPGATTSKPAKAAGKLVPAKTASAKDPNMIAQNLARGYFDRALGWAGAAAAEPVAVVTTEAMEPAVGDALREDLVIMDKLLREAVSTGAAERQAEVLGVKVSGSRVPPTYVEGAGVILTTGAGFPLLPGEDGATTRPETPRQRPSAWDRAKREVHGTSRQNIQWLGEGGEPGDEFGPVVEYDQAKVDALVDAIVKVMPEATNFRHLKDGEFVFVTVVGAGETGVPARLTLKAKKADIDAAARGAITPAEFKSRVATRASAAGQPAAGSAPVMYRLLKPGR